jgi:hypothetical protein
MIECKKHWRPIVIGLLGFFAVSASAAEPQVETCEQIRAQIKAQTGDLPKPDIAMLEKLGARSECRFSAAEVYRAAYGDKPMPQKERRDRRVKHRDDD